MLIFTLEFQPASKSQLKVVDPTSAVICMMYTYPKLLYVYVTKAYILKMLRNLYIVFVQKHKHVSRFNKLVNETSKRCYFHN